MSHFGPPIGWKRTLCIVIAGVLVAQLGCSKPAEDDGRLEHIVPAHKPPTFAAAIPELARRHAALTAVAADDATASRELTELREIVNWLPGLAAATDLKKDDWDTVSRLSVQLDGLLQSEPRSAAWKASTPEFQKVLEQLQQLTLKLSPADLVSSRFAQERQPHAAPPGPLRVAAHA